VLSRRRFLRTTLFGSLALGCAAVVGRHLSGYSLEDAKAKRLRVLSPKEFLILSAVAARVLDGDGPRDVEAALSADAYLAHVPAALSGDVRACLQLLEHTATATSRFTHLDAAGQDAVLAGWQSSRFAVKRQGFQALRTLCFLGYYRDPRTWPMLGYSGPMLKT
jgi:hypothetical protein